jgi:hypothetical protein
MPNRYHLLAAAAVDAMKTLLPPLDSDLLLFTFPELL